MAQNDKSKLADFLGADASALQAPVKSDPSVIFQTNEDYDPRIDLRPDQVIVHMHGRKPDEIKRGITSWQDHGHDVIRMFFASSDANQDFEQGRADGTAHTDAQETEANGNVLRCGDRAYTFPTAEWKTYCKTFIDQAVANGVVGISPEEPFAHGTAGYSGAYKRTFAEVMGKPWVAPYASPAAYWEACQFKSNQFYQLVEEYSSHLKELAAAQNRSVRYILPIHSLLSNMAGGRIFSNVRSIGLENVDAWIAQVWTGPVLWAMGDLSGQRYDGFFESALSLYSTFAELCRGVDGRDMYFLVDPVEDDPNFSWDTYRLRYQMCVAAMLQYPWVDHYEVMPWPDRIYLPGFSMGGGTPGPADYLTEAPVHRRLGFLGNAWTPEPRFRAVPWPVSAVCQPGNPGAHALARACIRAGLPGRLQSADAQLRQPEARERSHPRRTDSVGTQGWPARAGRRPVGL